MAHSLPEQLELAVGPLNWIFAGPLKWIFQLDGRQPDQRYAIRTPSRSSSNSGILRQQPDGFLLLQGLSIQEHLFQPLTGYHSKWLFW